ncbi:MAG: FAD-binding protein, partial [Raoultibacter sp.]
MTNTQLSRRSFLAGGALLGGALAASGLTACAGQETKSEGGQQPNGAWDYEVDIAVLGGGLGGILTA